MKNPSVIFDLTGRVAIITGGLGFLGQKHAETVACAGGIPVMVDIRIQSAAVQGIDTWKSRFGAQACALKCDITNPEEVHALLAEVLKRYGRVDILINNAAVWFSNPVQDIPLAEWNRTIDVNLTSAFLLTKAFLNKNIADGKG